MQSLLPAGFEERRGENRFIGAVELFHGVWIIGVGGSAQGLCPGQGSKAFCRFAITRQQPVQR
jgi:hypothetical protein